MTLRALALVVPLGLLTACGPEALAYSTFEGDDDGWTISNNDMGTKPTLAKEGGNPGGNLCGKDDAVGDIWYFVAPAKFTGKASSAWGKRLIFDLKPFPNHNLIRGRDVVLNGGGLAIVANLPYAPGPDWTPFSFTIDATGDWLIDDRSGKGPPATEEQIKTVLGSMTALRIRGEYVDGDDTACLDNVYWGTE